MESCHTDTGDYPKDNLMAKAGALWVVLDCNLKKKINISESVHWYK